MVELSCLHPYILDLKIEIFAFPCLGKKRTRTREAGMDCSKPLEAVFAEPLPDISALKERLTIREILIKH